MDKKDKRWLPASALTPVSRRDADLKAGDVIGYWRSEAAGAIPNGSLVAKCNSKTGDAHGDGSRGRVIGSLVNPAGGYGYFVSWDDEPGLPIFITGERVCWREAP